MVDWWQTGSIIDGFGYLLVRAVFERAYLPRVMEVPGFPLVTVLQPPPPGRANVWRTRVGQKVWHGCRDVEVDALQRSDSGSMPQFSCMFEYEPSYKQPAVQCVLLLSISRTMILGVGLSSLFLPRYRLSSVVQWCCGWLGIKIYLASPIPAILSCLCCITILRILFMNACVTLCISLNCSLGLILIRIPETGFSMVSRAASLKPSQPHPRSFCVKSNDFCNNSLNCGSYRGHRRIPNCYLAFSQGGKRGA